MNKYNTLNVGKNEYFSKCFILMLKNEFLLNALLNMCFNNSLNPGGPVVSALRCHSQGLGSILGLGKVGSAFHPFSGSIK